MTSTDRTGLLYDIARVLAQNGVDIYGARVATLGERAEDIFTVDGEKLAQERRFGCGWSANCCPRSDPPLPKTTTMFIGIDLGTSSVKAVLIDDGERLLATESRPLAISRPRPGWSEQAPDDWWQATVAAIDALAAARPAEVAATRGIGLSGQMHGAVLLDRGDRVLRPAILWNDGRSQRSARRSRPRVPRLPRDHRQPGDAGLHRAEAAVGPRARARRVRGASRRVLLPKDWLRLQLTGERRADMSDASGTLWLDVAQRDWSDEHAGRLRPRRARRCRALCEGSAAAGHAAAGAGRALAACAPAWSSRGAPATTPPAPSASGRRAGQGFLSLGTSGVFFAATDGFRPDPEQAVHAFCHALPAPGTRCR